MFLFLISAGIYGYELSIAGGSEHGAPLPPEAVAGTPPAHGTPPARNTPPADDHTRG